MKYLQTGLPYPAPIQDYKVLTLTMTFNQEGYISQTLDGLAAQRTDFPLACFVIDDGSTDSEPEVIREWMAAHCQMSEAESTEIPTADIVVAPLKDRPNCHFAFYFLRENMFRKKGKREHWKPWLEHCSYVATCEGDDYWTNPDKLQMQADYLDAHPDCAMCFGKVRNYLEDEKRFAPDLIGAPSETLERLLFGNNIPTLSTLYREAASRRYFEIVRPETRGWKMGDYPVWLFFAGEYGIHFMDEVFGVYRNNTGSLSHPDSLEKLMAFLDSRDEIIRFFCKRYHLRPKYFLRASENERMLIYLDRGEYRKGLRDLWRRKYLKLSQRWHYFRLFTRKARV